MDGVRRMGRGHVSPWRGEGRCQAGGLGGVGPLLDEGGRAFWTEGPRSPDASLPWFPSQGTWWASRESTREVTGTQFCPVSTALLPCTHASCRTTSIYLTLRMSLLSHSTFTQGHLVGLGTRGKTMVSPGRSRGPPIPLYFP